MLLARRFSPSVELLMINSFLHKIKLAFGDAEIRARILFLIGALVLFRLLATIPIPSVDKTALAAFFANNQFFGLLNIFSGGGLSNLSIVMLGVGPYITASIVMQLATIVFPKLSRHISKRVKPAGRSLSNGVVCSRYRSRSCRESDSSSCFRGRTSLGN